LVAFSVVWLNPFGVTPIEFTIVRIIEILDLGVGGGNLGIRFWLGRRSGCPRRVKVSQMHWHRKRKELTGIDTEAIPLLLGEIQAFNLLKTPPFKIVHFKQLWLFM
jgi:hypothetical protein